MLRELALTSDTVQSNEIFDMADEQEFQRGHWKMQKGVWHSGEENKQFLVLGIGQGKAGIKGRTQQCRL